VTVAAGVGSTWRELDGCGVSGSAPGSAWGVCGELENLAATEVTVLVALSIN